MTKTIIKAEQLPARELKVGDLFSTVGAWYWDKALDGESCGERVYIRTNADASEFGDADALVYRLTIIKEGT
jgi:hypothetical protein